MTSPKILVADDRPDDALLLVDMLSTMEYQVITASDGEEALAKAYSEHPELLILDIRMPKMDGYEVCHRIKADPEMKGTPVILLTSTFRDAKDKVRGYEAGADDYVTQPVGHKELMARVAAVLRVKALYDERVRQQKTLEQTMSDLQQTNQALTAANEELARLSITDPLTGAYTRQHLYERLNVEMGRARRFKTALAVLRIDIVNFRELNDHLGPQAGDAVLRGVVQKIRELLREMDILGRVGLQEFALVLPEADAAGAKTVAERICREIQSGTFLADPSVRVTISQGLAALNPESLETSEELMSRADAALRRARANGPASIVVA